ncbi:tetratricopeptide repeat protein [Nocardia sp. NPDC058519]|uniref:tetratricopeptide repeat protein n=1 Tax=Nocardia sp. NPDC058519 TaxID=3346535 RepID=UPI003660B42A
MTDTQFDRAIVLVKLGRLDAAREVLGRILAAEPDNGEARTVLAFTWSQSGDHSRAAESARETLHRYPEHLPAWKLLATAENALSESFADADPRLCAEHEDAAVRASQRCLELDPFDAGCHRVAAIALRRRDRPAALAAIERAIELEPDDAELRLVRGRVLWLGAQLGSSRAAAGRAAFADALSLDPANTEAQFLLGHDAALHGDWELAEQRLRRVAELDPEYGSAVREVLADKPVPSARRSRQPVRQPEPHRPSSSTGGIAGRVAMGIAVVVVLMALRGIASVVDGSDSPSTRPTSRPAVPSYYPPMTYFKPPLTRPQFPMDRFPTGNLWPPSGPRPTLPPNWTPPGGN